MRGTIASLLLVLLAGCASTTQFQTRSSRSEGYSSAADFLVMTDAARDMRDRIFFACTGRDLNDPLMNWTPVVGADTDDPMACYRDKLALAFADPDGGTNCAAEIALGDYVKCLGLGSYLNVLRQNAGSPKRLSPSEWQDSSIAMANTINEIQVQALVTCIKGSQAEKAKCQEEVAIAAFGLPASDIDLCRRSELYLCLAHKGFARFMQDRALLAW